MLSAAAAPHSSRAHALVATSDDGAFTGTVSGTASAPEPLSGFVLRALGPVSGAVETRPAEYLLQHPLFPGEAVADALLHSLPPASHIWPARHGGSGGGAAAHLWLTGHAPTHARAHFDEDDGLLLVLSGHKSAAAVAPAVALLHAPAAAPGLGSHHAPTLDVFSLARSVLEEGADASTSSSAAGGRVSGGLAILAELGPGDALLIPRGWLHEVRSAPQTVAVNWWWSTSEEAAETPDDAVAHEAGWPFRLRWEVAAGLRALEAAARADWLRACGEVARALGGAPALPDDADSVASLLALRPASAPAAPSALDAAMSLAEPLSTLQCLARLSELAPDALAALAADASEDTWLVLATAWEALGDASAPLVSEAGSAQLLGDAFAAVNAALAPPRGALRTRLLMGRPSLSRLQTTAPLSALLEGSQAAVRARCLPVLRAAAGL